jgi:hypothetical protein
LSFFSFSVHVTALGGGRLDITALAELSCRYGNADIDRLGPRSALLTFSSPRSAQDLLLAGGRLAPATYRVEKYSVTRHCAWMRGLLWAGLAGSLLGLSVTVMPLMVRRGCAAIAG